MLFGIGTDLCGCDRMARCLQSPAFAARVFSASVASSRSISPASFITTFSSTVPAICVVA